MSGADNSVQTYEADTYQVQIDRADGVVTATQTGILTTQITFADQEGTYQLLVSPQLRLANQAVEALGRVAPWLALALLAFSLLCAFGYSRYITRPIVRLNGIAGRMAELDLQWVCAGGSLGILIPPSIMLVSMGSYAEVSVGKIFFAAIVPGLSLSLGYIIYLMVVCHIHPDWGPAMSPEELAEMPLKKRITGSLINLIPPLILIFGVLGSIFGGIATPTEAAGIGALFSLILAIFYKQFSWKMLYESLIDTAKTTAMVFIILFGAAAFTGVFMSLDGDQIIADWVLSMGIGKWGAFAIMMVIMFLLGMFIDWLGIVMIVFPIFLPIMDTFGFDRLWLVAVSATLLQTCFMTPPFGFALFYVKGILPPSIKIQEVYRGVIPFIIIICIVTALCAVFPPLVTWLPSMLAS